MSQENTKEQTGNNKVWGFIKETVETVVVVLVLVILIRNVIGEPRWIPTGSMKPTLVEGDRLFIEKLSNFVSEPKRGDILVFYPPFEELGQSNWEKFTRLVGYFNKDTAYIKRVIGMPGDTIEIRDGVIPYINGKPLEEKYRKVIAPFECSPSMYCGPIVVPDDQYFMMGDNRNNSQDSRFWGFLPKDRVIGKAHFRFWPLNRVGLIQHPEYNINK